MIWILESLHAIPQWIFGGGFTLIVLSFIFLSIDWSFEIGAARNLAKQMWDRDVLR